MTFKVDFNMQDDTGRLPVVLEPAAHLSVGETIIVEDGEGNRCKALVEDFTKALDGSERSIALVVPTPGTWQQAS